MKQRKAKLHSNAYRYKLILEKMDEFDKVKHKNPEYKKLSRGEGEILDVLKHSAKERAKLNLRPLYISDPFFKLKKFFYKLIKKDFVLADVKTRGHMHINAKLTNRAFKAVKYGGSPFKIIMKPTTRFQKIKNNLRIKWFRLRNQSYMEFDNMSKDRWRSLIDYSIPRNSLFQMKPMKSPRDLIYGPEFGFDKPQQ